MKTNLRRLVAVLAVLLLPACLLVATVQPASAALPGYHCAAKFRSAPDSFEYPSGIHTWWLKFGTRFWVCKKPGHRNYSHEISTRVSYNRSGSKMSCSALSPFALDYFRVNPRFYDRFGHQFNPGEFHVGCQSRSWSVRWVHYSGHDGNARLWWDRGNTHAPRAHYWWGSRFRTGYFPPHGSVSIPMRGLP